MGLFSGIVGAVGGIASTILGNNSAKNEAQKNRDWQEEMSNTSIQRRMADLKAAGLNPLLATSSASAGASTPSGAQADIKRFNPADISALASARLVSAQAKAQEQENSVFDVKADKLKLENKLEAQNILNASSLRELQNAQTLNTKADILVKHAQRNNINMSTEEAKRDIQLLDVRLNSLEGTEEGQNAKFYSDIGSNPWKSFVSGLGMHSSKQMKEFSKKDSFWNRWQEQKKKYRY